MCTSIILDVLQVFVKENKNVYRGYFPVKPGNLSYKEGFEAGEETQEQTDNPLLEPTPFPHLEGREDECSWFKEGYTQVRRSLSTVADTLMEMIAEAGGERKDYFHPMFRTGTPLSTHRIISGGTRSAAKGTRLPTQSSRMAGSSQRAHTQTQVF